VARNRASGISGGRVWDSQWPEMGSVGFLVAREGVSGIPGGTGGNGVGGARRPGTGSVGFLVVGAGVSGVAVAGNRVSGIPGGQSRNRVIGFLVARNGVSGIKGGQKQGQWDSWWPGVGQWGSWWPERGSVGPLVASWASGIACGQKWNQHAHLVKQVPAYLITS
jgi:hypothetical protein